MNQMAMAAAALLLESIIGYPKILQNAIQHPVQWIGALITFLDVRLNDAKATNIRQRVNGGIAIFTLLIICALPAFLIQYALNKVPYGWVLNVALATPFIAQRSLTLHVRAVASALAQSVEAARLKVAKIVGRNPTHLNATGIAKAALESLAENTSDGIVAPILWYALLGLPGIVAYKAINTADSMIGHKSEKYLYFGWAAARLDDVVNLPASRLTGALFCIADGTKNLKVNWAIMRRDAPKHPSPNAGWPEAAMAAVMGLQLGGPRDYGGESVNLPTMGDGRTEMGAKELDGGLRLMHTAMALLAVIIIVSVDALL